MGRILPILALLLALGIAVAAVMELDSRSSDDDVAIATNPPSPTFLTPTEEPDETPEATPEETGETDEPDGTRGAAQETDEPTRAPTPNETSTPDATEEPEPTATVSPPRTPTPEPISTPGPIDASRGRTPKTGASSIPAGLFIAFVAMASRAILGRRRRTY